MERVLFYLPTVTPWWFENIVGKLILQLAGAHEVHVIVPPLWRNTGIEPHHLKPFAGGPFVHWHIADGDDHPLLRTAPSNPDALVELVASIDPAYVFCRSADIATPSRFPGKVRHLLEAGAPPLATCATWIILQRDFWHHGDMPELGAEDRKVIDRMFAGTWARMRNQARKSHAFGLSRSAALNRLGLEEGRKIVALPLEYEHAEAFTSFHNGIERNLDLIAHVADLLDEDMILAITDHPLNYKHVDNAKLYAAIKGMGTRVRLVPNPQAQPYPTDLLIKHCDGLIVQNTKAIYSGAFFGKPTLRLSHRSTAPWMGVHQDFDPFLAAVRSGEAGTDEAQARLWFGFHAMHEIINPESISAAELLDRVDRPFSVDRLAAGLDRIESYQRQLEMAA